MLTVSVVIPTHNYARFLPEAIESVLDQTVKPLEILIVDDASDDDPQTAVSNYRVRYIRCEHRNVHLARKVGFELTNGQVVLFLDADNKLPPTYLENGLRYFDERNVGIVYCDLNAFGEEGEQGRFLAADFDPAALELQNYIDASALFSRHALTLSRAFEGPLGHHSHSDWAMVRKVVEAGFVARKQEVAIHYRRHADSMMAAANREALPYYERAHLQNEIVTIFIPLSGRLSSWRTHVRPWLESQTWPRAQCRLVLADTSQNDEFSREIREWISGGYCHNDVRYYKQVVGPPGLADAPRAANMELVQNACRQIYARFARELNTPFAQIVEDDCRPPVDLIDRLMRSMNSNVAAVSGLYRSRFESGGGYVTWMPGAEEVDPHWPEPSTSVLDVGGTGFGALLLRRCFLKGETFGHHPGDHDYYDTAFAHRVRQKEGRWLLDRGCLVEHDGAPPHWVSGPTHGTFPAQTPLASGKRLVVRPVGRVEDRLKALASAFRLWKLYPARRLVIDWIQDEDCDCQLSDLITTDVPVISMKWEGLSVRKQPTVVDLGSTYKEIYVIVSDFFWDKKDDFPLGKRGPCDQTVLEPIRSQLSEVFRTFRSVPYEPSIPHCCGIHIRNDEQHGTDNRFFSMIDRVNFPELYLATNCESVANRLRSRYASRIGVSVYKTAQESLAAMNRLSQSTVIVRSTLDSFGQCAAWLGGVPTKDVGPQY